MTSARSYSLYNNLPCLNGDIWCLFIEDLNHFERNTKCARLSGKSGVYVLKVQRKRSVTKAITYRAIIIVLDVTVIYLLTGRLDVALGFMIISNTYTSIAYYVHERFWNRIGWGKTKPTPPNQIGGQVS